MTPIAGAMLVLAFALSFAACDNENGPNNPLVTIYRLALSAIDGDGNKHVLPVTVTGNARSARVAAARAVVPDGQSAYSLNFGGVAISEGTVTVSGSVYTFTPTAGAAFTYNENTKAATGSITISVAAKAAIAAGRRRHTSYGSRYADGGRYYGNAVRRRYVERNMA